RLAVRFLSRAVEADPDSPAARVARGRAFIRLEEFGLALRDFEKAHDLAGDGRTRACRAYCLNRLGRHREAIEHYERAIAAGFATKEVYNNLGYSYDQPPGWTPERGKEARAAFRTALDLDAHFQPALYNRALHELQQAENDTAFFPLLGIQDIERALC